MDPAPLVLLYTRAGCHLCDDARPVVARVCREQGAVWQEIDIATSADLTARYGEMIPVIEVAGAVIGYWRVDPHRLATAIFDASAG